LRVKARGKKLRERYGGVADDGEKGEGSRGETLLPNGGSKSNH